MAQKDVPEEKKSSPKVSIKDFAWLAGHWRGTGMGGSFEETWNPPFGNSMVGMFKLIKDEEILFYELMTIVKQKDKIVLRLKHFDKDLVGWEKKDKSVEFPFIRNSSNEAIFDGLRFKRIDKNTLHIHVRVKSKGKVKELKFTCKRYQGG